MDLTPDNDMIQTLTNPFENTDGEATVSTDYQAAVARGGRTPGRAMMARRHALLGRAPWAFRL